MHIDPASRGNSATRPPAALDGILVLDYRHTGRFEALSARRVLIEPERPPDPAASPEER